MSGDIADCLPEPGGTFTRKGFLGHPVPLACAQPGHPGRSDQESPMSYARRNGVCATVVTGSVAVVMAIAPASAALAKPPSPFLRDAGPANTKVAGQVRPNALAPGLKEHVVATGSMALE